MAVEAADEKRRTKFPCLDTVRYMVAVVVVVLTLAVAVKVITVDLRAEDIQLSILEGYIEASDLWVKNETVIYRARARRHCLDDSGTQPYMDQPGLGSSESRPSRRRQPFTNDYAAESCDNESSVPYTTVTYEPAASVYLRVTLRAYNPSGRVDVNCTGIALRILDTPDNSDDVTGTVEIAGIVLRKGFLLGPYSSHTVRRWMSVSDKGVLSYLATTYAGKTSFNAMVQVNTTIASVTTVRISTTPKNVTSECSVTVGLDEPGAGADAAECNPSHDAFNSVETLDAGAGASLAGSGCGPPPAGRAAPLIFFLCLLCSLAGLWSY